MRADRSGSATGSGLVRPSCLTINEIRTPFALSESRSFTNSKRTDETGAVDGRANMDKLWRGRKPGLKERLCENYPLP